MEVVDLIQKFGFPTVMVIGLGYFVYYVWQTITKTIDPAVSEMKTTIIRPPDRDWETKLLYKINNLH